MQQQKPMTFIDVAGVVDSNFDEQASSVIENLDRAVVAAAKHAATHLVKTVLSLKLTFDPEGQKLEITSELDVKRPNPPAHSFQAFVDKNGNLVDENPNQIGLFAKAH